MRGLSRTLAIIFLVVLSLSACAYNEGVIQPAEQSFLKFTGNPEGASVQIDQSQPFELNDVSGKIYKVQPGKHIIKIFRNGNLLVDRVLILDNETTKEVDVP